MKILFALLVCSFLSSCCLGIDTIVCDPKPKWKGYSLKLDN
ncbi:hypothetical protein EVB81_150 [Rhizobium phage RHph_I46]|uniref:Lipoprotein n=1 Tax=Rhizobium phage RHph_I1_9 TaxID=2509729 RepID=A0A7S5R9H5_9CAUD|nr:hypothetical protein PP936_gp149 [Rhizobium phage RHph_I1_9]QIG69719.1 hypothetical protein EVB81_150 [Rhizobium phage RHph_I46]QIG71000.1 hypothetical protein EVB92_150 [Rhizobium phage RHph_I9]QIG73586.1 hypothetical protein EVC04_149 [Rhizobium phage RHph_I1_9]QIG76339.1 hypothetical protein EVC25_150 [Rhizobium phage RHph_I34]